MDTKTSPKKLAANRRYYYRHLNDMRRKSREYYGTHKAAGIKRAKDWLRAHPEKGLEYHRRCRAKYPNRHKAMQKVYNKRYRTKYPEKTKQKARLHLRRVRTWIREQKMLSGCVKCGYRKHPAALDFHHVRGRKVRCVGNCQSFASAKREIEKCVVMCRNCHSIHTYENNPHKY